MLSGFSLGGVWVFKCFSKDGCLKWAEYVHNLVTDEFLNASLGVLFQGDSFYSTWYVSLIGSNDTPTASWTYANIGTDFTEFISYDEATRPEWVDGTIASKSLSSSASPATFTASSGANTTIYGGFLCNGPVKGDNAAVGGLICCATVFNTARPFIDSDVINIVYTINASTT